MGIKTLKTRIKAVAVTAAMLATTLITPSIASVSTVTAAAITINKTLIADGIDYPEPSQKGTKVPVSLNDSNKTIVFNFKSVDYTGNVTIGISGYDIAEEPWFVDNQTEMKAKATAGKEFSVTYTIPSTVVKADVKDFDLGIWYPQTNEKFTLVSAEVDGMATPVTPGPGNDDPGETVLPGSDNDKPGDWKFVDNKDGTATIKATLCGEIDTMLDKETAKVVPMDIVLTQGCDEKGYIDDDGNNTYKDGDPINSHKFPLTSFGIDDLETVKFQSFTYEIESDQNMNTFQYGGGINVEAGSDADTEYAKAVQDGTAEEGAAVGFWYNDQGKVWEDGEQIGDDLTDYEYGIGTGEGGVHGGWEASNLGKSAMIVWDVPKKVQPYVTRNGSDAVGFQFWYGETDGTADEESDAPALLNEVHIKRVICTYTREMTVPYNKTISKTVNAALTAGDSQTTNQYHYDLTQLALKERDCISAIKFNLSSTADIGKFVGGLGISVDQQNMLATDGWYQTGNVVVTNVGKTVEIMWIIPEKIRKDITHQLASGNTMFGFWYGQSDTATLKSIDFYVREAKEPELTYPESIELEVGQTVPVGANVPGLTIIPSREDYISIDGDNITGLKPGSIQITIITPEGQEATRIPVIINEKGSSDTTTTGEEKPTETTTTEATTPPTPNPDDVIDWSKVKYGDVTLDGKIDVRDVVKLSTYLLDPDPAGVNVKLNATQKENGDCQYDHKLGIDDASKILDCIAEILKENQLGDPEFYKK